jgi:hypothetical protein
LVVVAGTGDHALLQVGDHGFQGERGLGELQPGIMEELLATLTAGGFLF